MLNPVHSNGASLLIINSAMSTLHYLIFHPLAWNVYFNSNGDCVTECVSFYLYLLFMSYILLILCYSAIYYSKCSVEMEEMNEIMLYRMCEFLFVISSIHIYIYNADMFSNFYCLFAIVWVFDQYIIFLNCLIMSVYYLQYTI